jgi:hypothetical protein
MPAVWSQTLKESVPSPSALAAGRNRSWSVGRRSRAEVSLTEPTSCHTVVRTSLYCHVPPAVLADVIATPRFFFGAASSPARPSSDFTGSTREDFTSSRTAVKSVRPSASTFGLVRPTATQPRSVSVL